ncbi:TetR/AcrR family transcriptional regulator [Nocardia sp. CA2R105]|uniref:TetR/AcrR family transcriptional regulator n=1 Tax=Nocardia coffeae TaxID=2873381 RepID=UPI001CA799C8|nr:TetR/AcrR family transcriptional regulator [Nocardia coffeae]
MIENFFAPPAAIVALAATPNNAWHQRAKDSPRDRSARHSRDRRWPPAPRRPGRPAGRTSCARIPPKTSCERDRCEPLASFQLRDSPCSNGFPSIINRSAGSGGVSLHTIAKRADVGQGTLYRHFPTREAVVLAVYWQDMHQLLSAISPRPAPWGEILPTLEGPGVTRGLLSQVPPNREIGGTTTAATETLGIRSCT